MFSMEDLKRTIPENHIFRVVFLKRPSLKIDIFLGAVVLIKRTDPKIDFHRQFASYNAFRPS